MKRQKKKQKSKAGRPRLENERYQLSIRIDKTIYDLFIEKCEKKEISQVKGLQSAISNWMK